MFHKDRVWCVTPVASAEELAQKLTGTTWTCCTGFERGGYLWLNDAPIEIQPETPARIAGLQAVDYFLWALQRVYERGEERYWEFVADKVSLVHDVDDTRNHEYGEYYTKRNLLTAAKCAKKEPGI